MKVVLKALAEKLHDTHWWQYALYLVTDSSERLLSENEKPMLLLNAEPSAKLLCKRNENPVSPRSIDDSEIDDQKETSVDPLLQLSEIYLRLRASSLQQVLLVTCVPFSGS